MSERSFRRTLVGVVLAVALVTVAGFAIAGAGIGAVAGDGTAGTTADDPTALEQPAALSSQPAASQSPPPVEPCAAEPPEDFAAPEDGNDTIGWFDGYWYNQPLEIDADDGLTEAELEQVSARTAARFEALRCLTFESMPPVEIVDREEFAEQTEAQYGEVDQRTSQFDNAQFETLLLIGSEEDAIEVRQQDRSATVGGYYDFVNDEIVVISDDPNQLQLDEAILAHELGHALQNQHFDLAQYTRDTRDLDNGKLGVIEGDVHRVEQRYLEYCQEDLWNEPCILDDAEDEGDAQEPPNWGLYFMQFQPYSDGPSFVDHVYEEGGWDAVDALYDDMPRSSVEVIYPEHYGEFETADLEVADRSSGDWERLTFEDGPDHNVIGQAGLSAIFMDPAYDGTPIVDPNTFLNIDPETGDIDPSNPLNYDLEATSGWEGDRLYVYENDDHTGSVWKLAWSDNSEAATFVDAYEALVDVRGGQAVDGYAHTYTFGEGSEFDMALTIYPDDDRVWIVTAPTVDALTDVHDDVELVEAGESPLEDDDADDSDTDAGNDSDADDDTDADDDATGDDGIPGFGIVAAVSALLATAGFAMRLGGRFRLE
ncbi:Hvo_1808 family surface protein [Natronosalvus vescus]|uniref:Hvo_1808 family surface protein n=1 Tax=Natronosalvus vescus TaxID=2953881 RepID=UPI00209077CD|nr:Hvo_1808 family surface protein [Natronosalvus vescus]